jgi:hypothetical protein
MKKTVSWHTETLKQEDTVEDADTSAQPPPRSASAAAAPVTNPQVNARIQQMVAMQRAQNASMRQLMSNNTDYGGAAASPSGLRDLVTTLPRRDTHTKSAQSTTSSTAASMVAASPPTSIFSGTKYTEPMKPPATLLTDNNHNTDRDVNINYQGPLRHSLPPNQRNYNTTPPPILQGTPPLLYPKYPFSDGHDSPVSYNSVLDQNSTPSKVVERKRAQKQLQTIQSQQQMEMQKSESVDASSIPLQPSPTSKFEAVDWGSMEPTTDGYSLKPIPQHSDYGAMSPNLSSNNGLNIKDTMAKPVAFFPQARPLQQEQLQHNTPASDQLHLPPTDNNRSAHTQHQFHYGDNLAQMPHSYHDSSNIPHSLMGKDIHFPMGDIELRELQQRSRRRRRNLLWQILCYPIQCLFTSEQIGRSFCFGAIDGMLTGAGILAAYIGLGILSHVNAFGTTDTASFEADMHRNWILVALTLAACFSDGVCMAIGHVWSTRLVAGASFEERKEELRSFETSRSDAKARLVDALLLRGMLKIDAMSLADTLEGYPDLFVSALLGEGFCGASGGPTSMGGLGSGGGGGGGGLIRVPSGNSSNKPVYNPIPDEWNIPAPAYAPGVMAHEGLKYESYSEFSDLHQDPDVKTFSEIMSESRLESLFMMLSFGSFSIIPSLVYTFVPYIAGLLGGTYYGRTFDTVAISVSVGVTSIVMFLLGAWKR